MERVYKHFREIEQQMLYVASCPCIATELREMLVPALKALLEAENHVKMFVMAGHKTNKGGDDAGKHEGAL